MLSKFIPLSHATETITLPGNDIEGTIPTLFGNFSRIGKLCLYLQIKVHGCCRILQYPLSSFFSNPQETMELSGNAITGSIPVALTQLNQLSTFELSCACFGTLQSGNFSFLISDSLYLLCMLLYLNT